MAPKSVATVPVDEIVPPLTQLAAMMPLLVPANTPTWVWAVTVGLTIPKLRMVPLAWRLGKNPLLAAFWEMLRPVMV